MSVGSLLVRLEADIAQYTSSLDKASALAEQRMQQIDKSLGIVKTSLTTLGAGFLAGLSLDAIKNKIEGVIASAANMSDLAARTGATVEALSGLNSIAKLSNTDSEALATGLQKLAKSMVDAENGGKKTASTFQAIGISMGDLKNKSPDQIFQLVSQRLSQYQDGTEKVVVAQNLLGKAGANLLPVMKDLAEVGDLQVKLTAQQAQQAKELEQDWKRLQMASDAVWKSLALALVPTMGDFVRTLIETQKQTGGVKSAVDDLAKDHTIRDWAQSAAIALSYFIEALQGVIKLAGAVAGSFQAVWADIKLVAENANPVLLTKNALTGDLAKQLEERNKTVADANKRYIDLWNYNGTQLSDTLKKRFAISNTAADFGIASSEQDGESRRHGLSTTSGKIDTSGLGNANKGPKDDPAKAIMDGVMKSQEAAVAASRKALAESDALLQESYQQQYLTASQFYTGKKALIEEDLATELAAYNKEMDAAQAYINQADTEQKRQEGRNQLSQAAAKYLNAQADAQAKIAKATMDYNAPLRQFEISTKDVVYQYGLQNAEMQFQIDLLGKSALEVQKLTSTRQIDLALQARIHDLKSKGYSDDELASRVAEASANAEAQKAIVVAKTTSAYDAQRDALFGANEALRKYAEDSTNAGAQIGSAVTDSLKGMEDALVSFVTTGKANWKSLADSIIAQLARVMIQEQIMAPLTKQLKDMSSGGGGIIGGLTSLIGGGGASGPGAGFGSDSELLNYVMSSYAGGKATGGYIPPGQWGWTGEEGPEPVFGGNTGVTVLPNSSIGSGQAPITIHNSYTVGDIASTTQLRAEVKQSEQRMLAGLTRAQKYGTN